MMRLYTPRGSLSDVTATAGSSSGSACGVSAQASQVAQWQRICLPMQETQVRSLSWKDPLEKEMATIPVFLPGKSHGFCKELQRVRHDLPTEQQPPSPTTHEWERGLAGIERSSRPPPLYSSLKLFSQFSSEWESIPKYVVKICSENVQVTCLYLSRVYFTV